MSTNEFGGGNSRALYLPISEIEQEFLSRLIEQNEIFVVLHGYGIVQEPKVTFGDKNLHIHIAFFFDKAPPPPGKPVSFFDMELKTRSGISLYRQKMSTLYNNQPLTISNEVNLNMVWDIALRYIDPKLIKALMPNVIGYTSRLEDRDNHDMTITGNMRLSKELQRKAYNMAKNENFLKQLDEKKLQSK